jgi:hypothetical protein
VANEWNVSVFQGERKLTFRIPTHECDDKVKIGPEEVAYNDSAGSALPALLKDSCGVFQRGGELPRALKDEESFYHLNNY